MKTLRTIAGTALMNMVEEGIIVSFSSEGVRVDQYMGGRATDNFLVLDNEYNIVDYGYDESVHPLNLLLRYANALTKAINDFHS